MLRTAVAEPLGLKAPHGPELARALQGTYSDLLSLKERRRAVEEQEGDAPEGGPQEPPACMANPLTPCQAPDGTPISALRAEVDRLVHEHGTDEHADVASARARLADALHRDALLCGCRICAAKHTFLKATFEQCRRLFGQAHPNTMLAACALSAFLVGHDDAFEAEKVLKGPLEAVTTRHGPGLHNIPAAFLMRSLAVSLTTQQRLQDVEKLNPLSRALLVLCTQYSDDSAQVRGMLAVTADFFYAQANYDLAQDGYLVVQHETHQDLKRAEERMAQQQQHQQQQHQEGVSKQGDQQSGGDVSSEYIACLRARILHLQLQLLRTRAGMLASRDEVQELRGRVRKLWEGLKATTLQALAARINSQAGFKGGLWGKLPARAVDALLARLPPLLHAVKDNDAAEACADLLLMVREITCLGGGDEERIEHTRARLGQAIALGYQGKKEEAGGKLQGLKEEAERTWGRTHPVTMDVMHALAENLRSCGERLAAIELYDHVLVERTMLKGPLWPPSIIAAQTQGECNTELDLLVQAERLLHPTVQVRAVTVGHHHPDTVHSMRCLAACHIKQGRKELAVITLLCAYTNIGQYLGSQHPLSLRTGLDLAGALESFGSKNDAARQYERLRPMVVKAFGEGSSEVREVEDGLARCAGDRDRDRYERDHGEGGPTEKKLDGTKKNDSCKGGCCFA